MNGIGTPCIFTPSQHDIIKHFYSKPKTLVVFDKKERDSIWDNFKSNRVVPNLDLSSKCPALLSELNKALANGNNVQSAVFSECVYAQTLANQLGLPRFINMASGEDLIPPSVLSYIRDTKLTARYVYVSDNWDTVLVQAGGNGGVDGALISISKNKIYFIEFKEPAAKTSEHDLPKYSEDGNLLVTEEFLSQNPQFRLMLEEQLKLGLNFWQVMGTNVNNFTPTAISMAVSENYVNAKHADVICVEDKNGYLTMLPVHEASLWASLEGEIRPAGRNSSSVWNPIALENFIFNMGGSIDEGKVTIAKNALKTASQRGGNSNISRYKINSIFFVRVGKVSEFIKGVLTFNLSDVKQLKPTISAKMFFKSLEFEAALKRYKS